MDSYAVVILNYNGIDHLKRFLPSVSAHSGIGKIVVVDNGSTDNSIVYLEQNHPEIQTIPLEANFGFSGGYNRGLQQVDADVYFLINSDLEVTPDWTTPMLQYLQAHPKVGICQPKIRSMLQKNQFDYAGAAGGYLDILGYPFCRGRIFNQIEEDRGQYDDNRKIFWAGGACLAIRSHLFHQLGGFDRDFFAHMEEIDLCWRCQLLGWDIAYIGSSTVFHLGGGTLSNTNTRKTYLNFRNALSLLVKNSAIGDLCWKLPLRLILDGFAAMRFLLTGSLGHFLAVIQADMAFFFRIPHTWSKRAHQNNLGSIQLYNKSVVWEHFVRGKKTFGEIDSET